MNNNIGAVQKEGTPYNYPTVSKLIVLKTWKITRKNTYMIVAGPQFETILFFFADLGIARIFNSTGPPDEVSLGELLVKNSNRKPTNNHHFTHK